MGRTSVSFKRGSRNANIHANLNFMHKIKKYANNTLMYTNIV